MEQAVEVTNAVGAEGTCDGRVSVATTQIPTPD